MRWFKKIIAVAVLSMTTALAGVGASYGQDKTVRIGYQKYGKLVLLKGKGSLDEKLKPLGYKVVWTEFPSGPPLLATVDIIKVMIVIGLMLIFHWTMRNTTVLKTTAKLPWWVTGIAWSVLLILVILSQGTSKAFIYFQF